MDEYNFLADVLDTFQFAPNWIKALWLLIPPGFLLALTSMVMRYRIASKKAGTVPDGQLIYSVYREADDQFHIVSHGPQLDKKPALLLIDPSESHASQIDDLHAEPAQEATTAAPLT